MSFYQTLKGFFSKRAQKDNQTERVLRNTAFVTCCGLVSVLGYALGVEQHSVKIAFVGIVVAGAALAIGALLGLLFGIPRSLQATPTTAPTTATTGAGQGVGNPDSPNTKPNPAAAAPVPQAQVSPNTNLEQISDWLTKILVGISLTRFNEIQAKFRGVAQAIARSLGEAPEAFAAALMLFFLVCGFLISYLWVRRYLEQELRDAGRDDQLREEGRKESTEAVKLATRLNAPLANLSSQPTLGEVPSDAVGEAASFSLNAALKVPLAGSNPADPWKGQFGGRARANNRELSAEVHPFPGNSNLFNVRLRVSSTDPDKYPLSHVNFFLHPTFPNSRPVVSAMPNSVAELTLVAWGAFTVGAMADLSQTKLELDLSELPDAPKEFRER